jgi:hypothetical protein
MVEEPFVRNKEILDMMDPKRKKVKMSKVYFFLNGNTAFFKGENQVPKLQEAWIILYIKFLEKNGIDPETCEFQMPSGRIARPFRIKDAYTKKAGWNWRFD